MDRFWSARVGLHYRTVSGEATDGVLWFWIGTHGEYYKLFDVPFRSGWRDLASAELTESCPVDYSDDQNYGQMICEVHDDKNIAFA